ncbi:hypothetical protein [Nitrosomonas ureae]|uniref:Uncharacterized protein n=1 Tax=Nitrosomonas ureae TaxID=44577 RepID=A0A1H9AUC4_9PROT|nr:hypothetical protein [Nitrosomonas ureae]SEP80402.1 hypothetical protein SAMN05421510_100524 [Nitrosomonas ureae]
MFEYLKNISELLAHWATVITLIVLICSVCLASKHLKELKTQRHWQNFNEMNVRYAELLGKIPEKIKLGSCSIESDDLEIKIWIRQYFDLYSEEYWLNEKKLLPEEMWKGRIRPGVVLNLKEYPILEHGYIYWKNKGAFNHPKNFHNVVDEDIQNANEQGKTQCHCAN